MQPFDKSPSEKTYVRTLRRLIASLISGNRFHQCIYGEASLFFQQDTAATEAIEQLQLAWELSQTQLRLANKKTEAALIADVKKRRELLLQAEHDYEQKQLQRQHHLLQLCHHLLNLTEGSSRSETIQRSSKLLGTLQLLAPSEGDQIASVQQKYKPFYKAVLSLRLLDHLLEKRLITNSYILKKVEEKKQQSIEQQAGDYCPYRDDVQVPILMAVLLQDIGHYHPDAVYLLQAEPGQPHRYREFDVEERQQFLEISQQASLKFLLQGVGVAKYRGNSKAERDLFQQNEQDKLAFAATLLRTAANPGTGIGNLLRIPQVYASAVLPGRARFVYEALPKVALILKNGARQGNYDERMVDQLLTITGIFPQGYGVVFLPKEKPHQTAEKYEFAIVNSLYPRNPEEPLCRVVTRNLHYRATGHNCSISVEHNLYFKPARLKLAVIPPQRLQEILSKLTSSFEPGRLRNLMPRCWHPDEYFSDPKQQNLWNKAELEHI